MIVGSSRYVFDLWVKNKKGTLRITGIIQPIQKYSNDYKLEGSEKLRINKELPDTGDRIKELNNLLSTLAEKEAA